MPTAATPSKLSVVFAGEEFLAVELLDGSTVAVRVRAMPVRHLGRVLSVCTDEAALLELVCLIPATPGDQGPETTGPASAELVTRHTPPVTPPAGWQAVPEGWADNLTDNSHAALLEAARRQNFSRAATWAERQIAAKEFQGPILMKADEALAPLAAKMAALLISSLPPSARPAGPVTKS